MLLETREPDRPLGIGQIRTDFRACESNPQRTARRGFGLRRNRKRELVTGMPIPKSADTSRAGCKCHEQEYPQRVFQQARPFLCAHLVQDSPPECMEFKL